MLRFFYSMIALALVLSPLGMARGGTAMAHAPAAEMGAGEGHCGDSQAPDEDGKGSEAMLDCMGICSALAAGNQAWPGGRHLLAAANQPSNVPILRGLNPESELPPPRLS